MPRTHRRYAPEYPHLIIELACVGRSLSELARQFELTVETIRALVKQTALEGLRSDAVTTDERAKTHSAAPREPGAASNT